MGQGVGRPVTTKHSQDGRDETSGRCFGVSSCQGWRPTMEDAHIAALNVNGKGVDLFGVFDGHGGKSVAEFCRHSIRHELIASEHFAQGNIKVALERAFMSTDERLATSGPRWQHPPEASQASPALSAADGGDDESSAPPASPRFCGSTAVVAVIVGKTLFVSNAGDSRAVLCKNGRALPLSTDHKPMNESEMERIQNAGGSTWAGRVNGRLAVSRSLGDLQFKQNKNLPAEEQMVSAFPEVCSVELDEVCDFLVLACDGVWDVMSNQEAVDFIATRIGSGMALSTIVELLMDACIAPDPHTTSKGLGCDNMTAVIVTLSQRACDLMLPITDPSLRRSLKDLAPRTIYDAARGDDAKMVLEAIAFGDPINGAAGERETPLHTAAAAGSANALVCLLDQGANMDMTDGDQRTALHRAVETNAVECVRILCTRGANPNALAQHGRDCGWTPMHYAAEAGNVDVANILIAAGAHIEGSVQAHQSPFAVACMSGNDAFVRLLLQHHISADGGEGERHSPLWSAVAAGHEGVVSVLLEYKASVNGLPNCNSTPLHAAAEKGYVEMVRKLLDAGANINSQDEDEATPLLQACQVGHPSVVALLLERGADATIRGLYGKTPLDIATLLVEKQTRDEILALLAAQR